MKLITFEKRLVKLRKKLVTLKIEVEEIVANSANDDLIKIVDLLDSAIKEVTKFLILNWPIEVEN